MGGAAQAAIIMPTSRARHLFFFALLVACLTCTIHAKETTAELLVSDFLLAGDEIELPSSTPLPSSSAPSVLVTEIQFGDRAGGPDWLELFNSGDEEVDLSGVAVEILSGEEDEASLDGNETGKWIDAVNCEGRNRGGLARESTSFWRDLRRSLGRPWPSDPGFWAAPCLQAWEAEGRAATSGPGIQRL